MKNKLLMAHLVAGYPTTAQSHKLAETLVRAGAGILEIQIPFSDPIADGPIIVGACHTALRNTFRSDDIFDFIRKVSRQNVPIAVMTYANIPLRMNFTMFLQRIAKAGATHLIIPDLPFDSEESKRLRVICVKHGMNLVQVVSPGMSDDRLKAAAQCTQGFIYCTTRKGTTGQGERQEYLSAFIRRLRDVSNVPIALGFGISTPQDIRKLKMHADILITGSAIIAGFQNSSDFSQVYNLVKSMEEAL